MAAAIFEFGRIPGVSRPALAALIPRAGPRPLLLLDAGANADCKPLHLQQFALMGSIYAAAVLGMPEPRVGLLSIGEEPTKGNELVVATHPLLAQAPLNFIGNVEGRHVTTAAADVIVCDGFTGNVVLKTLEGAAEFLKSTLEQELRSSPRTLLGALLAKPAFVRLRARLDYAEYGGAPLVGLTAPVFIAHGRSNAKAIASALRVAHQAVQQNVGGEINRRLAESLSQAPTA